MTATGARYHPALIAQAWMTLEPGDNAEQAIEVLGSQVLPVLRGARV